MSTGFIHLDVFKQTPVIKGYALLIGNEQYDEFSDLSGPIKGVTEIGKLLENNYGYQVESIINASKKSLIRKFDSLSRQNYNDYDHLLIYYIGQASFNVRDKEGYVIPIDAINNGSEISSYLSYAEIVKLTDGISCNHLLLVLDGAFGKTFSQIYDRQFSAALPKEVLNFELKLKLRTRYAITSGGKNYVPGPIKGEPSVFTNQFIIGLKNPGTDNILELNELKYYLVQQEISPAMSSFGSDEPGSDFFFIVNDK